MFRSTGAGQNNNRQLQFSEYHSGCYARLQIKSRGPILTNWIAETKE
jgi:hypothetical protein